MSAKANPKAEVMAEERMDLGLISTILLAVEAAAAPEVEEAEEAGEG